MRKKPKKLSEEEKRRRAEQRRRTLAERRRSVVPGVYITPRETAARYGRTEEALSLDRHRRIGWPFYRFGRLIRYKPTEIDAILEAGRVEPQPDEAA
jgi:hypothetical protein